MFISQNIIAALFNYNNFDKGTKKEYINLIKNFKLLKLLILRIY